MTTTDAQLARGATRLARLRSGATWSLLRAHTAPAVATILRANFLDSGEPRVPAPILFERLNDDLAALREVGMNLPRSAQEYCADWLGAGWLERRADERGSAETYELSSDAHAALRMLAELESPPSAATESRLTTVMESLHRLMVETDPDASSRLAALEDERDRLEARIAALREGRVGGTLDDATALERVRDILALAGQLPGDFTRVRREIENLHIRFRREIVDNDGGRGDVLDALFRGVDILAEQEAGRSFRAFYALLIDAESNARLDAAIETVLGREFAGLLASSERDVLNGLVPDLVRRGGEVNDTYGTLARSLRGFVQHREYVEERRMARLLTMAQREVGRVSERVSLIRPVGVDLTLSTAQTCSVGTWQWQSGAREVPEPLVDNVPESLDLEDLRRLVRESEIDLRELRGHIADVLEDRPVAGIGDVLAAHPASQGFGSIVGLVYLAIGGLAGEATLDAGGVELVPWDDERGVRIPRLLFVRSDAWITTVRSAQ